VASPGDFGLYKGTDTVGRLIELGEWANGDGFSRYSHAFVLLDDATILEAEPGGARIRPVEEYPAELITWSSWDLSALPGMRSLIVTHARLLLGTPYSFLDYFALATHRLHLSAPGLQRYVASTGHMICSQLVDEVYRRAGLQLFADGRWPGYVTPADLEAVLHDGPKR
jgi:cell wall-associated NlpC family hydrolase